MRCHVWQDPVYKPYLGQLAKLGFFASGIHQAVFAIRRASQNPKLDSEWTPQSQAPSPNESPSDAIAQVSVQRQGSVLLNISRLFDSLCHLTHLGSRCASQSLIMNVLHAGAHCPMPWAKFRQAAACALASGGRPSTNI